MSRRSLLAVPVLATAVGLCGCASASTRAVQSLPPVAALHKAQKVRADWLREIRTRARTAPAARFHNPSRVLLRARLRRLEGRYGFRVVELRIYRPRQQAPLIVVETADKAALARNTHRILRVIDPKVFKVNLIPYNPTGMYEGSSRKAIAAFKDVLDAARLPATVRLTRGRDIAAACGQLAAARA